MNNLSSLPEQQLKSLHQQFLDLAETRNILNNLKKQRNQIIDLLLTESVSKTRTDSEIRMMAAEAKGYRDIINYISNKHESIT